MKIGFLITIGIILSSAFTTTHASRVSITPKSKENTVEVVRNELKTLKETLRQQYETDSNSYTNDPMP